MAGKLRFEAWTLPTAATFERQAISIPVIAAEGRRELSAFSDCRCDIPDSWSDLATLATAPLIRVFDGTTVLDEFVAERGPRQLRHGGVIPFSGPQLGQWGLSRTLVYPPDYGTNPSKRPNWKWGMKNLIELGVGGLGNTNEVWSVHLSGERYELDASAATAGTYTLTVGAETTAAIDWDASASAIRSALQALTGVTTVSVSQAVADVSTFDVVFDDPKDLASNMTITDSTTGGVTLTKVADGFDTSTDPTFTITVDGETTTALPWDATANQVEGNVFTGAGLQGLASIDDVAVSGSGTFSDPWEITFFNPPDIGSLTVTFAAGAEVASRVVAGGFSAEPVTVSKPIDEGTGSEEVHGSYDDPALEVVTDIVDTDADFSVKVNATGRFAGSQLVLNVESGEIYQSSIRLRPAVSGEYVLVIHDENQNQIARTGDVLFVGGAFQELSLSDILIPAGIERVIMRVAVVSPESSTHGDQYVNWQGARFVSGLEETNPGDIVSTILAHSQTQGDGTWIDFTADATVDSGGSAWPQVYSYQADGFAMHMLHVLEDMRDLGYEFTLTPKATPSGGLTHDLNLYLPGGAGTDRTATGPTLMTGGAIVDGEIVDRIPGFTVGVAWGAEDLYVVDENTAAKNTYGRMSRVFDAEQHASSDTLQDVLDAAFDDEESNRKAASVTLSGSGSVIPGVHFDVGDTLVWQAADRMAKNNRRVATVTWSHGDPVAVYEVQGSRVWGDPLAAIAEGLRRLMDAPRKRRRGAARTGIDRAAGSSSSVAAHIHLLRSAVQSIDAAGTNISWDGEHAFIARENFAAVSGTDIVIQEGPADYNVAPTVEFASAVASPFVEIRRNRGEASLVVWPPDDVVPWRADFRSRLFNATSPVIPCLPGDIIRIRVGHGEASAQNLVHASVSVYLVERTGQKTSGEEAYRALILSQEPIAYWRLGELINTDPASDETGNGHHGTYSPGGGLPTVGVDGLIAGTSNTAVDLNAAHWVEVFDGDHSAFDVSAITVKAWVTTSATGPDTIVSRFDQTDAALWDLLLTSGAGTVTFKEYGSNNTVVSTTSINDGATHHVVVTYDGTTAKLYIDGTLDNSATWSVVLPTDPTVRVRIGDVVNLFGQNTEFWDGKMDEVAIWGRALTASEIAAQNSVGRSG